MRFSGVESGADDQGRILETFLVQNGGLWGAWVAQWVKASAFGPGHDPRVLGSSPTSGSLLSREPASSSLSLFLPLCLLVISVK